MVIANSAFIQEKYTGGNAHGYNSGGKRTGERTFY